MVFDNKPLWLSDPLSLGTLRVDRGSKRFGWRQKRRVEQKRGSPRSSTLPKTWFHKIGRAYQSRDVSLIVLVSNSGTRKLKLTKSRNSALTTTLSSFRILFVRNVIHHLLGILELCVFMCYLLEICCQSVCLRHRNQTFLVSTCSMGLHDSHWFRWSTWYRAIPPSDSQDSPRLLHIFGGKFISDFTGAELNDGLNRIKHFGSYHGCNRHYLNPTHPKFSPQHVSEPKR